ncbi:helix-turn-helix transcriptional regulator [Cupriavidus necator]|uniref:Helix-turn-helix transcriptional regulator n=1 Tax=Cupriavidus necator TaxID=106590 RepID=A0A1U9UY48_CUPNE|nr:helix-turn-helix transcriptional regulator [Cupriavidus necator]
MHPFANLTETGGPPPKPTVLASKLAPPVPHPATIGRPQLVARMAQDRAARVILLRAAAGFGKTTLMQQYVAHCAAHQQATTWLRLDAGDNDLERLLVHLDAALAGLATPRGARRRGAAAPAGGPRLAQRVLEQVGGAAQPFALVLDDLETLQSPPALDFVQQLIEVMPPCGMLVIGSRTAPEIGLGRLRARGQLLEIPPAALHFSIDEATELLRGRCGLPLRDGDIATLYRRTEGWATAIYLAALSLQQRSDHAAFVATFSGTHLELGEFLTEDLLARQSDACRAFLLETSVLGQLNVPLCNALTGRGDAREMLNHLERANLLLFPLDAERTWYRYHRLFASFLQHRLAAQAPERVAPLHLAAAHWYLEHGYPIPAVDHLLQAGRHDEALDAIASQSDALLGSGRVRLLLRWFDQVRPEALARQPALALTRAWALLLNRRHAEAMATLASFLPGPEHAGNDGERARLAVEAQTIRCVLLAMTDQVEACRDAAGAHLHRLAPDEPFQYRILANSLAYALICTHRYDEARSVLSRATLRAQQPQPAQSPGSLSDTLEGVIDLVQGRLGNALARLRAASGNHPGSWNAAPEVVAGNRPGGDVFWALALFEHDARDEAGRLLANALPYSKGNGPPDAVIACHVLSARLALARGDRGQWLQRLAELEQLGQQSGTARIVCSAWLERARVATLEGKLESAAQALQAAELYGGWEALDATGHANDIDRPSLARCRLDIARGNAAQALSDLDAAVGAAQARQRYWRVLRLRILRATALDRLQQREAALLELTEALRLASHEGFYRTFLEEGEPVAVLLHAWAEANLAQAAALGVAAPFVADLLERLPAASGPSPVSVASNQPDPLTGRELEVLHMLSAGYRNRVIAQKLFLSELTVKSHLRRIHAKLGAQSRTEAVALGRARGLIP